MQSNTDPKARMKVWCHRCGEKSDRSRGDGLLAACTECGSTDVHIFAPPSLVPFKRRRAAMVLA